MICILEDNNDRVRQFLAAAKAVAPEEPARVWRSAHVMIRELADCMEDITGISLDHDLNSQEGDIDDPGCGYDVAKILGELQPICPVIIHTSNGERGRWMEGELSRGGWKYERIYPFGDDWIANDWMPVLRRLLHR